MIFKSWGARYNASQSDGKAASADLNSASAESLYHIPYIIRKVGQVPVTFISILQQNSVGYRLALLQSVLRIGIVVCNFASSSTICLKDCPSSSAGSPSAKFFLSLFVFEKDFLFGICLYVASKSKKLWLTGAKVHRMCAFLLLSG